MKAIIFLGEIFQSLEGKQLQYIIYSNIYALKYSLWL